jgi:hypothetical protein
MTKVRSIQMHSSRPTSAYNSVLAGLSALGPYACCLSNPLEVEIDARLATVVAVVAAQGVKVTYPAVTTTIASLLASFTSPSLST